MNKRKRSNCYKVIINVVLFRINLAKTKDWEFVINLDEFKSIRTKWIVL